jgi:RNA 2',3'-cyclic 3'-phosphodiesterase
MRLFVALGLPADWRAAAVEVRRALESSLDTEAARALRWVDPALLHLTLRFLGEFPDTEVPTLQAALQRTINDIDLELSLAEVGGFGGRNRLQVIWLGLAGDVEGLRTLAEQVDRACVEVGAPPEARGFQPHVTIARVRERTAPDIRRTLAATLEGLAPPAAPLAFRPREIALVRSHLGNGPPRYQVLSRHPAVRPR